MFDAPLETKASRSYEIDFPYDAEPWNIGLIVGPSGSGKSTIMRHVFGESPALRWDGAGIVDDMPGAVDEVADALGSVGFSTPPAWLRPHRVLSMGEQFRADIARRLLESKDDSPIVVDEYTSVVDRQVAQIASHAIQRYVRKLGKKFVAVGCHYDVIDWLQPDWVLDMATQSFTRRLLRRRPELSVSIGRLPRAAWGLFAPFHYMTAALPPSTHGFGLWCNGRLACSAWLAVFPHPTAKDIIRVARVVTLPDYQGIGLAFTLLHALGAALRAGGKRFRNYPAHPAFIAGHAGKPDYWAPIKDQTFGPASGRTSSGPHGGERFCAVFEYRGPANARFATALGVQRHLADKISDAPPVEAEPTKAPQPSISRPSQSASGAIVDVSLLDFIPRCDPTFRPPFHLRAYVDLLERAPGGNLRAMVSVPIRHFKTWTTICGIAWWLLRDPTLRIIYMTYSLSRAEEVGKDIRETCRNMGCGPDKGHDTIKAWRTPEGGGVTVMSADQSRLGTDCDILIWDDPIEGPTQADDARIRNTVNETIAFYTNRMQVGGSCIGIMSRFHPDDPIGRRTTRGWQYVHHAAIERLGTDEERAFAPDIFPLDVIKARRLEMRIDDPNERTFWGQWQNEPRAPTTNGFGEGVRYAELPTWPGYRDAMGIDMSYSETRRADHAAFVVTRWWGPKCFVRHIERCRADIGDVTRKLYELRDAYGRMPVFSYVAGPEIAAIHHLSLMGVPVAPVHATAPKFIRARRTIDCHNAGRIMWAENIPGLDLVIQRLRNWTGNESDPDDEADALVSVHDQMCSCAKGGSLDRPTRSLGSWRY